MFNISWPQVAISLIIWFLRKISLNDWFKAAIKPSILFWETILEYRLTTIFKLQHSGQVIYLEHLLNAIYNNDLPAYTDNIPTGIYIGLGSIEYNPAFLFRITEVNEDKHWLFRKSETPTAPRIILYRKSELENLQYDFTINIPTALGDVGTHPDYSNFGLQIKAWVQLYAQAGKRFKIVNF